jgi:DNA-directed RNA polymerase subunit RPC12/RpoP
MAEYYIIDGGIQVGPYSAGDLKKMLHNKMLTPETSVQISGGPQNGKYVSLQEIIAENSAPASGNTATLLSFENNILRIACPACGQHYKLTPEDRDTDEYTCVKCSANFRLPPKPAAPRTENWNDSETEIPEGDLLCPHCWKSFDRDYVLYISVHPSLFGDPVLGEYVPKRFVPTVFNQAGQPLDPCGLPATEMACPRCHLHIPAGLLDAPALYFSIAGATSSGKSYFLTCLTHQLRKTLPEFFGAAFFDADPRLNDTLNTYEKQLFMALEPENITALPATQIAGAGISDRVRLDNIEIELPKPFVFEFRNKDESGNLNMIFYDNSGEMFIPGRDEWMNQATCHLSHSDGIVFLFDPTNDASMRLKLCDRRDPQVSRNPRVVDQTVLLNEMISRIRRHANMLSAENCQIPLVIAVGKYDTWKEHFSEDISRLPLTVLPDSEENEYALDMDKLLSVSFALRELMLEYAPGLVNAAESFFDKVFFIPVSNFGTLAEQDTDGIIGVVPGKISPCWVEVPLLIQLAENHQLPAFYSNADAEPLGKIVRNRIVFTHPETGKNVRLPESYANAVLQINGKTYRLPEKEI